MQGWLDGNKTYIALAVGALVIAANHFGFLPETLRPQNLDPSNWVNDEYKLIIAAVFRSAITKVATRNTNAAIRAQGQPGDMT